ncbi:hypothetical protein ENROMM299B_09980 [Enterobacter roggenkampii]|nr:Uncharacterised protein [Enterobacter roggenkampii]
MDGVNVFCNYICESDIYCKWMWPEDHNHF